MNIFLLKPVPEFTEDSLPAFWLANRIAYLILSWAVIAYILSAYTSLMNGLLPADHIYREYLICGGQLLFQGIIVSRMQISSRRKWDWLFRIGLCCLFYGSCRLNVFGAYS